jgi:hypothetical protein
MRPRGSTVADAQQLDQLLCMHTQGGPCADDPGEPGGMQGAHQAVSQLSGTAGTSQPDGKPGAASSSSTSKGVSQQQQVSALVPEAPMPATAGQALCGVKPDSGMDGSKALHAPGYEEEEGDLYLPD